MDTVPVLKLEVNDAFESSLSPKRKFFDRKPKAPPGCLLITDSQVLLSSSDTLNNTSTTECCNRSSSSFSFENDSFVLGGTRPAFALYSSAATFSTFTSDRLVTDSSLAASCKTVDLVNSFLERIEDDIVQLMPMEASGPFTRTCDDTIGYTGTADDCTTNESAGIISSLLTHPKFWTCPEAGSIESYTSSPQRAFKGVFSKSANGIPSAKGRVVSSTAETLYKYSYSGETVNKANRKLICRVCSIDGSSYRPSCPMAGVSCSELCVKN